MTLILEPPTLRTSPIHTIGSPSSAPPPPPAPRQRGRRRRLGRALVIIVAVGAVASLARIVGLPEVVTVAAAVGVGLVVRHLFARRDRRHASVARLVVAIAVMLAVSATSWSFTGTLTDPGSDPVTDRTANWMRDHHMNLIVDTIEQHVDTHPMTNGAVERSSLPNAPAPATQNVTDSPIAGTAPTPTTSAPAPAATVVTSSAPPTTAAAPIDHTPAPAGPLIDSTLYGEGQWTANTREVNGVPATYTTFVRPDPANTGVVAAAVELVPAATRIVYVPGVQQPGGTGWAWGSTIPLDQRPDLVAAFNSGWKQKDATSGIYTEGRTAVPLADGLASLVIYADGHTDIGVWGTDVTMTPDVVSVRQNLDLVVVGSQPVDGLTTGGSGNWGSTKYQTQFTRRSGLGITSDGALVYVAGTNLTTDTLARALVQVGAVRGMELDIHNQHPTFNFFTPAPGTPDMVTGQSLLPDQVRPATRYLQPDQRDFFAVLVR